MGQTSATTDNDSLVISYLNLRKAIGIIGIALPFVLVVGKWLLDRPGIQSSISAYYHTVMPDVFVGILCAIGVFLFSYRGYGRRDNVAGTLAGIFAIGVALFPTSRVEGAVARDTIGLLHLVFAALFFLTLAYFSLVLFRKTDPRSPPTSRKKQRNVVYTVCGYGILACLAGIAGVSLFPADAPIRDLDPVFWLEAAAVVAFGVSWLTKGEAILKDLHPPHPGADPRHAPHEPAAGVPR